MHRPAPHTGRRAALLLSAALFLASGCDPWNLPHDGSTSIAQTWDDDIVAADDALYVMLPRSGDLLRVAPDGTFEAVDLRGASPRSLHLAPDDSTLLAFASWPWCDTDDSEVEFIDDCPAEDLEEGYELNLVQGGEVKGVVSVPPQYNRVAFSPIDPTGAVDPVAVAYLEYDPEEEIDISGIQNLTDVQFINLELGSSKSFNAGFAANNVLFTQDATRAVVLSRSRAVVVDLTTDPYEQLVSYPLSMDADQAVDPSSAVITGDDQYLLIAIQDQGLLYAMDLQQESINVVDLASPASSISEDEELNLTTLVYANRAQVDVVEHDYFDVTTLELDEPCTQIATAGAGNVVLYNDQAATHDVYRLDLLTNEVVEYVVGNPVTELHVAPGEQTAVAVLRPEGGSYGGDLESVQDSYWGLSLIDLTDDDSVDLWLESEVVGLAFAEGTSAVYALVLLAGLDELYQVNLTDGTATTVSLPEPATGIGALPGGGFYITHQSALGMVSFLAAGSDELVQVNGFAVSGLLEEEGDLPRQDDVLGTTEE